MLQLSKANSGAGQAWCESEGAEVSVDCTLVTVPSTPLATPISPAPSTQKVGD